MISGVAAQSKRIAIPLQTVVNDRVFNDISTNTIGAPDSIRLKNIPPAFKDYSIRKWSAPPDAFALYIFYGLDSSGRRGVIIDSDFDLDLAGEVVNYFPSDVKYVRATSKTVMETIQPIKINYSNLPSFFIKPNLFNCCRGGLSGKDSTWFMEIVTAYERHGLLKSGNVEYRFITQASVYPFAKSRYPAALVGEDIAELRRSMGSSPNYELKETFFLKNHKYVFDSVNVRGDTAWVIDLGLVAKAIGPRSGEFAPLIQGKDLVNGSTIHLGKLKGKYVLLDFWGTWCGPCIEAIPDLKKLRQQYPATDLYMLSVAYDEKNLIPKLKSMIADLGMKWSHVFDNSNDESGISSLYRVNSFPTTILIDPAGKIIFRGAGLDDFPKLTEVLKKVMQKQL